MTTEPRTRLVVPTSAAGYVATRSSDEMHVESSMVSTGPGFITQSGTPSDEEFEVIRSNFGDPRANVRPTDYYAFRMIASGDGLDSYFTRQDVETSFNNFVRDLKKGQSVLGSHQMATFSYGSSFDGEIVPADESRAEYEGTFYPQWDTPDLRTRNWLTGNYYIGRGVTLNGQSSDDLIRSIELGSVRKASISFMVGQYVCGLDGHDLINTMFGPMPDDACTHFPGVAYEGSVAWALMKNNTLVETSLVYKNASPSSMLLRKAETLASRGVLKDRDIQQLEGRFQVRLPRFERTLWTASIGPEATNATTTTANNVVVSNPAGTTISANGATWVTPANPALEDDNMAGRRRADGDSARALAREALTADPEPEQDEAVASESEPDGLAPDATDSLETDPTTADDETTDGDATESTTDANASETPSADEPDADEAEVAEDAEPVAASAEPVAASAEPVAASAEAEVAEDAEATTPEVVETVDATVEADAEASVEADAEAQSAAASESEIESTAVTPRGDHDVISTFVGAADALVSAMRRNPDAFATSDLDFAARAERSIDLALIDAGCDTTVGAHVARTFATRSRELDRTLGEPLTVEALRSLQSKATLGDTLYEELVKDAVAARTGIQGESFNGAKYRDLLLAARDVAYVKEEIASWKEAKQRTYTPGRSVVPRQVTDVKASKEDRKSLPEAPTIPANAGRSDGTAAHSSILEARKK